MEMHTVKINEMNKDDGEREQNMVHFTTGHLME